MKKKSWQVMWREIPELRIIPFENVARCTSDTKFQEKVAGAAADK